MDNRDHQDEQLVQLISGCQRRLFVYLTGLLCSRDLADDALQETNLILWRKRSQYRSGTNFFAWACQIAYFEACKARQQRRDKTPSFSDVFLDAFTPQLQTALADVDPLQDALLECVKELNEREKDLLDRRYDDGATTRSVADSLGQSPAAIYKSLSRIHEKLFDCVNNKIREERRP